MHRPPVTIRRSVPADSRAVARLAALDSARVPQGDAVIAEIDHQVVAALPLSGGRAIADPFRPTAEIVRLLELRAAQLRGQESRPRRWSLRRMRLLRPLRAPAR